MNPMSIPDGVAHCPAGHELRQFRVGVDLAEVWCDECGKEVRRENVVKGCRTCDLDLCMVCCKADPGSLKVFQRVRAVSALARPQAAAAQPPAVHMAPCSVPIKSFVASIAGPPPQIAAQTYHHQETFYQVEDEPPSEAAPGPAGSSCPAGHLLWQFRAGVDLPEVWCDRCTKQVGRGKVVMGCRICDVDFCEDCCQARGQASMPRAGGWEPVAPHAAPSHVVARALSPPPSARSGYRPAVRAVVQATRVATRVASRSPSPALRRGAVSPDKSRASPMPTGWPGVQATPTRPGYVYGQAAPVVSAAALAASTVLAANAAAATAAIADRARRASVPGSKASPTAGSIQDAGAAGGSAADEEAKGKKRMGQSQLNTSVSVASSERSAEDDFADSPRREANQDRAAEALAVAIGSSFEGVTSPLAKPGTPLARMMPASALACEGGGLSVAGPDDDMSASLAARAAAAKSVLKSSQGTPSTPVSPATILPTALPATMERRPRGAFTPSDAAPAAAPSSRPRSPVDPLAPSRPTSCMEDPFDGLRLTPLSPRPFEAIANIARNAMESLAAKESLVGKLAEPTAGSPVPASPLHRVRSLPDSAATASPPRVIASRTAVAAGYAMQVPAAAGLGGYVYASAAPARPAPVSHPATIPQEWYRAI